MQDHDNQITARIQTAHNTNFAQFDISHAEMMEFIERCPHLITQRQRDYLSKFCAE